VAVLERGGAGTAGVKPSGRTTALETPFVDLAWKNLRIDAGLTTSLSEVNPCTRLVAASAGNWAIMSGSRLMASLAASLAKGTGGTVGTGETAPDAAVSSGAGSGAALVMTRGGNGVLMTLGEAGTRNRSATGPRLGRYPGPAAAPARPISRHAKDAKLDHWVRIAIPGWHGHARGRAWAQALTNSSPLT